MGLFGYAILSQKSYCYYYPSEKVENWQEKLNEGNKTSQTGDDIEIVKVAYHKWQKCSITIPTPSFTAE
ncbi:MAG TPA: hypothetical protein VF540_02780 [Segetibacter sp.]